MAKIAKAQNLVPPCGYKGGKRTLAKYILPYLFQEECNYYFDLCCGSGAIALSLIQEGVSPSQITMLEAGPWGMFWQKVSDGSLDIDRIQKLLSEQPADPKLVQSWVENTVCSMPVSAETFLVIQAAAYGSTPAWHDGTVWRGDPSAKRSYHARPYWEPSLTSKEKKPRGTIFCPDKIVARAKAIKERCAGIKVFHGRLEQANLTSQEKAVYYLDPPYQGTTGYAFQLDVEAFIAAGPRPLLVSEGRQIAGANQTVELKSSRGGAVTSGSNKTKRRNEFLNIWR